jgi:hypothetical protein
MKLNPLIRKHLILQLCKLMAYLFQRANGALNMPGDVASPGHS